MNAVTDSGVIRLLDSLVSRIGALNLTRRLVTHDGAGWEDVHCGFDDQTPTMVVAESLGDEDFEEAYYLPGRRLAPLLTSHVSESVERRRQRITELHALVATNLPRIYETLRQQNCELEAELKDSTRRLQAQDFGCEKFFPWEASTDPIKRGFHHIFLDQLQELLPKLAQGQPWSGIRQTFVPQFADGGGADVVMRAELFGLCTQVRVGSTEFCQHLISHVCEVIAYYLVLADQAQYVLDTTLPQLVDKMKRRGVW